MKKLLTTILLFFFLTNLCNGIKNIKKSFNTSLLLSIRDLIISLITITAILTLMTNKLGNNDIFNSFIIAMSMFIYFLVGIISIKDVYEKSKNNTPLRVILLIFNTAVYIFILFITIWEK